MASGLAINDNWREAAALWALPVEWRSVELSRPQPVEARLAALVPLMEARASCGFPSPADDYLQKPLDFNELLGANRASIFAVDSMGDSMAPLILPGDRMIVDRAITAVDKHIIVGCVDGLFTLKRFRKKGGKIWLQAENTAYQSIYLHEDITFEVWGVVVWILRQSQ